MNNENINRIKKDLSGRYEGFKQSTFASLVMTMAKKKNCENLVEHYYDVEEESYEDRGISNNLDFNNWEELVEAGNWGLKQEDVNKSCIDLLQKLASNDTFLEESSKRVFARKQRGYLCYWVYVRDLFNVEYTFSYKMCFVVWAFWQMVWNVECFFRKIDNYINDMYYK